MNNTPPTAAQPLDLDSLTRYELCNGSEGPFVLKIMDGEYVKFSDVAALIAQARAAQPAEKKSLPPEATEKKAKLLLSLRADSGYMADETHRISAEQWGRICAIVNEKG